LPAASTCSHNTGLVTGRGLEPKIDELHARYSDKTPDERYAQTCTPGRCFVGLLLGLDKI
jgi:hypothetical protein